MIKSSQSLIFFLVAFLATLYLAFYLYRTYSVINDSLSQYNQRVDIVVYGLLYVVASLFYVNLSLNDQTHILSYMLYSTKTMFDAFSSLVYAIAALVAFYFVIYFAKIPMGMDTKPSSVHLVETKLCIIIVTCLIVQFFAWVLRIAVVDDVYDFIVEYFPYFAYDGAAASAGASTDDDAGEQQEGSVVSSHEAAEAAAAAEAAEPPLAAAAAGDEVFHVSNNLYTYQDAQYVCAALDAKLANYDQVEDAYNRGAEWCGYGWSDGQMALYPTQKKTWTQLQEFGENNDCGRPGINGGYIANPNVRFGVNCFGQKPAATDKDLNDMGASYAFPTNPADDIIQAKVNYWKEHADKLLVLNSFNKDQWSEY